MISLFFFLPIEARAITKWLEEALHLPYGKFSNSTFDADS